MSGALKELTVLDALVAALARAGRYNRNDQVPPVAVLWTDEDRQWEPLVPRLRERLPLFTFGSYDPAARTGPAYWLRCVVAGMLPDVTVPDDAVPILYLPGVSRQALRAVEDCPRALQPLAELQFRGVLWTQKNTRDWTIAAFLQNADGGLGVEVRSDGATRAAMGRALVRLADEPVERLRRDAPLGAAFFDALLNPDEVRAILLWLNDPAGYPNEQPAPEWDAFCDVCLRKYGVHPARDGALTAARKLGERVGNWQPVWQRFADAPRSYPRLPDLLRQARGQGTQMQLFDSLDSWPQVNDEAEARLRERLLTLAEAHPAEARAQVTELEREHGRRRAWVWAGLGWSPLAVALGHLVALASATERSLAGAGVPEIAAGYAGWGWRVDRAALDALATVKAAEDVAAVKAAANALYRPWLEGAAVAFQTAVRSGPPAQAYPWQPLDPIEVGTCLLFSDALRFDAGMRLAETLEQGGVTCRVDWRLAALPPVTPTAKPAVSPIADRLGGGPGLQPAVAGSGTPVSIEGLRRLLAEAGYQILRGDEVGDPAGRAWAEIGAIDVYGHNHGWRVAQHLADEVQSLAERVQGLLAAGWRRVVMVTDHGWLLLPGGLPKADLPAHLTEVRKGRCARLTPTAQPDYQTVPWHWDPGVRIAVAPGIACFEAGTEYEHGGLSPQECVVPVLTVTRAGAEAPVSIADIRWRGLRCNVTLTEARPGLTVDIRTRPGDPATSILDVPRAPDDQGRVALFVRDDDREGDAAMVVVLGPDGAVLAQAYVTVGG